ncbi:MAG TPA: DUF4388 domain-containing protein, partial [Myxococcales bacterium]
MRSRVLVADGDPRSLRILELALGKAGILSHSASDPAEARRLLPESSLVVCDAALCGVDLCRDAKAAHLPVIVLSADKSQHAPAVEAGADEFLQKPVVLKELVQRVQFLLERKEPRDSRLFGAIRDLALLDVFHSLAAFGKSAVVRCRRGDLDARVWVKDGEVVDAELDPLRGEAAFYRLLTWEAGEYQVHFGEVDLETHIPGGTHGALVEAMRRADELTRAARDLPMTTQLEIDYPAFSARVATLPAEVSAVVRQFDGHRSLRDVIDRSPLDDLATVHAVQKLRAEGVLKLARTSTPPFARKAASARAALGIVRYPPVRGVHRERLRREALAGAPRAETPVPSADGRLVSQSDQTLPPHLEALRAPRRLPAWPWLAAVVGVAGAAWFLRASAPAPQSAPTTGKRESPLIPVATPAHREAGEGDPATERGEELLDRGQYREAIAELKLGVSRNPQSAAAYVALGNAYLEADQPGLAVDPLQTAVKLEDSNPRAHLLLGTALQSLGKNHDAAKAYRRYLELDPGGEYAHD